MCLTNLTDKEVVLKKCKKFNTVLPKKCMKGYKIFRCIKYNKKFKLEYLFFPIAGNKIRSGWNKDKMESSIIEGPYPKPDGLKYNSGFHIYIQHPIKGLMNDVLNGPCDVAVPVYFYEEDVIHTGEEGNDGTTPALIRSVAVVKKYYIAPDDYKKKLQKGKEQRIKYEQQFEYVEFTPPGAVIKVLKDDQNVH